MENGLQVIQCTNDPFIMNGVYGTESPTFSINR